MFKKGDWFVVKSVTKYGEQHEELSPKIGKMILSGIGVFVLLIVVFGSFGTIGAGEKGVRTRLGAVTGEVGPGLYVKLPIVEHIVAMDIQTQKEQTDAEAASSDLQTVHTKVAINYSIDPSKVQQLYSSIGEDYKIRVIDPAIQEAVKAATAKYTAEELITKRPAVQDDIKESMITRLAPQFISVSNVSIINFDFSATFNQAIEAKVTAEQNALAAKNKLDQVKFEAEQTVATAKAQAEAIRIQAEAITQQGGANYVQLKIAEKWNGVLPTQMVPGSAVPFINLKNQ